MVVASTYRDHRVYRELWLPRARVRRVLPSVISCIVWDRRTPGPVDSMVRARFAGGRGGGDGPRCKSSAELASVGISSMTTRCAVCRSRIRYSPGEDRLFSASIRIRALAATKL